MTTEDALCIKPRTNDIIVFDAFTGKAYEYLKGLFDKTKSFM